MSVKSLRRESQTYLLALAYELLAVAEPEFHHQDLSHHQHISLLIVLVVAERWRLHRFSRMMEQQQLIVGSRVVQRLYLDEDG